LRWLEFERSYSTIGADIAAFGGPDWTNSVSVGRNDGNYGSKINRNSTKGSPVVPGSAKKVHEEGEFILFTIGVLKGHYEAGLVVDDVVTNGDVLFHLTATI